MKGIKKLAVGAPVGFVLALFLSLPTSAFALPLGWTCNGNCGTSGADGVVTAPPGGSTYDWVSSNTSSNLLGALDLNLGAETDGSILHSTVFSANAGDPLQFNFNYVTSDGAGFADYAWARLLTESLEEVGLLFTARTTTGGDTAPGFGMPANFATLTPASTPIIPGGPVWSPLGPDSGSCFDTGCGYTGWIQSNYTIAGAGSYILEFGVVDWSDEAFSSGLAFAGATVAGKPIDETPSEGGEPPVEPEEPGEPGQPGPVGVPEPATLTLFGLAVTGIAAARRRTKNND